MNKRVVFLKTSMSKNLLSPAMTQIFI